MIPPDKIIADIIGAADGEIVGRIRLQKILYLLCQRGLQVHAAFQYHHYGPYSRILDDALDRAKAFYGIKEETRHRYSDGAAYSVFRTTEDNAAGDEIEGIDLLKIKNLLRTMKSKSSTVLELAATIHWLINMEKQGDWQRELVRRKGIKTENGRLDDALELLQEIELFPMGIKNIQHSVVQTP